MGHTQLHIPVMNPLLSQSFRTTESRLGNDYFLLNSSQFTIHESLHHSTLALLTVSCREATHKHLHSGITRNIFIQTDSLLYVWASFCCNEWGKIWFSFGVSYLEKFHQLEKLSAHVSCKYEHMRRSVFGDKIYETQAEIMFKEW